MTRTQRTVHNPLKKTFLVVGGTGKVGSRLSRILRAAGNQVRVASRTGGDVHFDWRIPSTYGPALAGVDGVFLVGPGSATDWSDLLQRFLEISEISGVRHIVLLSARGVEFLPDGVVAHAEDTLRRGRVPWTILRPSHFAQNFTESMFVPTNDEVSAPVGSGVEPFIDVEDLAEVAAVVLSSGSYANVVIELSGPIALSFADAVGILTEHAGRPLRFIAEDPDEHVARLRMAGTPDGYITWRMAMLDGIRRDADSYISDGVLRVLGRPATDFAVWAAREGHVLRANS